MCGVPISVITQQDILFFILSLSTTVLTINKMILKLLSEFILYIMRNLKNSKFGHPFYVCLDSLQNHDQSCEVDQL